MRHRAALIAVFSLVACAPASAQTLARRIADAPDGRVRLSFPARPNVCGYEDAIIVRDEKGGEDHIRTFRGSSDDLDDIRDRCVAGPVRLEMTVRDHAVQRVRTRVGVGFAPTTERVTDLGAVSATDAVDLLVALAPRIPSSHGDDALLGVTLAAGVDPAPRLLQLAGNAQAPVAVREKAVFWAAESGATAAQLGALYARSNDVKVRDQILFAYSRIQDPSGARELLRVARGDGDMELRKKAVFWLGQRAGEEITRDLGELANSESEDEKIREQAIFALSQRRGEGVPALLQIARTNPDPRLRKRAIFWLGQSGDPRAVDLFESILTKTSPTTRE
jgi:hypothetical protein